MGVIHRLAPVTAGALILTAVGASAHASGTSSIRVTGNPTLSGNDASVEIAWSNPKHPSYADFGKNVSIYIHKQYPGNNRAQTGHKVSAVDMTGAETGTHKFSFDITQAGLKPGDDFVVTAHWAKNGHTWGDSSAKPGGETKLPAAADGLALLRPEKAVKAKASGTKRAIGTTSAKRPGFHTALQRARSLQLRRTNLKRSRAATRAQAAVTPVRARARGR